MKAVEYILTGDEMQEYDRNTIERLHVPGIVLMEQAALAACRRISQLTAVRGKKTLVLAGTGNNGGDAMAVARLLRQQGADVTVLVVTKGSLCDAAFAPSAFIQHDILQQMGISIVTELPSDSYDMIIDGIFGVGLNREITGRAYEVIEAVNEYGGLKIALDIPSGIHASTGRLMGCGFVAHVTITFGFYKRGLFLGRGPQHCGRIFKEEIGITEDSFFDRPPGMISLSGSVGDYLPFRDPGGHKGSFGKILVVAGSQSIGGAALLSAKAAMMSGAGMVRICTHKRQYEAVFSSLPEAIYDCYDKDDDLKLLIQKAVSWTDVIVLGPGMGTNQEARVLWREVIEGDKKPLLIDADGLNLLATKENTKRLEKLQQSEHTRRTLILTPHPLELARICHCERNDIAINWEGILKEYAGRMQATIVKKDARTIICDERGRLALNLSGNHGMATAGSGDVLCGIIASLMARRLTAFVSAVTGVYFHGRAGELAAEKLNHHSMLAGDICQALTELFKIN